MSTNRARPSATKRSCGEKLFVPQVVRISASIY